MPMVTMLAPQMISIHASREGGDYKGPAYHRQTSISIHASREGGDPRVRAYVRERFLISIHASREGGDQLIHR